jgi:hypothetical protein
VLPSAPSGSEASNAKGGGGKLLVEPDENDIFFLYYAASGANPSFSEIADLSNAVKSADEFNRGATHAKVEAELKAKLESVKGVGFLQVNLNDSFGQYDDKYKEYDLDMGNGTTIPFSAFGRNIDVVLTNGGLAQSWKLDSSEAAQVLKKNGGNRNVQLLLHLQVLDAPPATSDSRLRINVRVLDYDVRSYGGDRLGRVVVTN